MINLFDDKRFIIFLIIVNIISGIIALFYYYNQLISTDILLWIFVADCPIFAFLFALSLFYKLKEKENNLLGLLATAGVLKYSLWTIFVILFTINPLNYLLILVAHILFLIQIIVLYKYFTFKLKHVLIVLPLLLISDFFDYVFLTHPPINTNYFAEIAVLTVILSFFSVLIVSIFFSNK